MTITALTKVAAASAGEIADGLDISDEARARLADGPAPPVYLQRLLDDALFNDAVRFLASALPTREAVWWACACARHVMGADVDPGQRATVRAAEAWVFKPSEETRRAAMARAEAIGFDAPSSWAAAAAFWSGGSIAPAESPPVEPAPTLTPGAVFGAAVLAAAQGEASEVEARYRALIALGVDIANGGQGR